MSGLFLRCAAGALMACATGAYAGISEIQWTPLGDVGQVLDLGADGEWGEGEEYTYADFDVDLFETWTGGFGSEVGFHIELALSTDRTPELPTINFHKNVTNTTNFFWTDFHIILTPDANSGIENVQAMANAEFGSVMVMDNMDGSWAIWWDNFSGGTGVPIGGSSTFWFSFQISGNLGFQMKQIPTPTPAGAALFGVAGLVAARRRRA